MTRPISPWEITAIRLASSSWSSARNGTVRAIMSGKFSQPGPAIVKTDRLGTLAIRLAISPTTLS